MPKISFPRITSTGSQLPRIPLLGYRVNTAKRGPGLLRTPALTGGGQAFLLPRRWPEYLVSMSGGDGSHLLHLGLVGRHLWLGRDSPLPFPPSPFPYGIP